MLETNWFKNRLYLCINLVSKVKTVTCKDSKIMKQRHNVTENVSIIKQVLFCLDVEWWWKLQTIVFNMKFKILTFKLHASNKN